MLNIMLYISSKRIDPLFESWVLMSEIVQKLRFSYMQYNLNLRNNSEGDQFVQFAWDFPSFNTENPAFGKLFGALQNVQGWFLQRYYSNTWSHWLFNNLWSD